MRRIRKLLLTVGITLAMLLPLGAAASADPGDPGGFGDPTITAGPITVQVAAPGVVTVTRGTTTITSADPGDPGGFGP